MEKRRWQECTIVAASFLTLLITVGIPFYGLPFFYDFFIRDFGWSRAEVTSGIALATILIQPAAGLIVHRFSPRRLVLVGCILLGLSLVAFALNTASLLFYYFAWCLFMAGYVFAGPLPNQVILTNWFDRNRGMAMGISYLGLGFGGALSQKWVAYPLIQHFGWRWALVGMGALMLPLIPVCLLVLKDAPAVGRSELVKKGTSFTHGVLVKQPRLWLLALGSAASIGAIGSINQHMKLLFQDGGQTSAIVAGTTFTILISSLAGRLIMGALADRCDKNLVMVSACALIAISVPFLFWVERPWVPDTFAVIFGFGLGADYMLIPLIAAEVFGRQSLALVMGVILPVDSVAQTCFPFLVGVLRDHMGTYYGGLIVIITLAVMGVLAIAILRGSRIRSGVAQSPIAI
jgi:MFS family permease